jgi:hypothetical protein
MAAAIVAIATSAGTTNTAATPAAAVASSSAAPAAQSSSARCRHPALSSCALHPLQPHRPRGEGTATLVVVRGRTSSGGGFLGRVSECLHRPCPSGVRVAQLPVECALLPLLHPPCLRPLFQALHSLLPLVDGLVVVGDSWGGELVSPASHLFIVNNFMMIIRPCRSTHSLTHSLAHSLHSLTHTLTHRQKVLLLSEQLFGHQLREGEKAQEGLVAVVAVAAAAAADLGAFARRRQVAEDELGHALLQLLQRGQRRQVLALGQVRKAIEADEGPPRRGRKAKGRREGGEESVVDGWMESGVCHDGYGV